jgi:UDP-glucose 4-epimerase
MKQTILITGVSGFIGSRIALRAKESGHKVIGSSRSSVEYLQNQLGIPVIKLDLSESIDEMPQVDTVIHCATANDILSRNFDEGLHLSINGTRNLLEAVKNTSARNFIFFSTLQVYGRELHGDYDESSPILCENQYALNHYFGEELCKMYSRQHGMNTLVVRPSNVYGISELETVNRKTLVPSCFVVEALRDKKITLLSSGKQMRNFVSTDEVSEAVLASISSKPQGFSILNAASNWNCSIIDIARMTADVYFKKYGDTVDLVVKDERPMQSNEFRVHSKFADIRHRPEESEEFMRVTIAKLFEQENGGDHG